MPMTTEDACLTRMAHRDDLFINMMSSLLELANASRYDLFRFLGKCLGGAFWTYPICFDS